MPLHAFLDLTGANLGPIKGSALQKTRAGKISVIAFDHVVHTERQTGGGLLPGGKPGQPENKRRHHSFTITKEFDHASPLLHKAHATGEVFSTWELHCWRVPPAGGGPRGVTEENHYTIFLGGARVAAIRSIMGNIRTPAFAQIPEYEEVEFTYERIGYLWKALKGDGTDSPATSGQTGHSIDADFSRTDDGQKVDQIVNGVGADLGKSIAKEITDAVKAAAKEAVTEAMNSKK